MLKPDLITVEDDNPLVDLADLDAPITVDEFAEFEGIDPLANCEQLQQALDSAYEFVERHIGQSIIPTGRRFKYVQRPSASTILVPGIEPEILSVTYDIGGEIVLPSPIRLTDGSGLICLIGTELDSSKGPFSILARCGMIGEITIGKPLLSAVQMFAKGIYESVDDSKILLSVFSRILPYKVYPTL